jgi:hypothetical protein
VIDALTNCTRSDLHLKVKGHGSGERGWASLDQLRRLAAPKLEIPSDLRPCLLIRPRSLYRYGMTEQEMWEVTRKWWQLKRRPDDYYKHVFCVHDGIISWRLARHRLGPRLRLGSEGTAWIAR